MDRSEALRRSRRSTERERSRNLFASHPFRWGLIVTLGVLVALVLGLIVVNLKSVLLSIFIAAFIALGLDPLIRWFQRRGMSRSVAIVTVILIFVLVVIGIVWIVVPPVIAESISFIRTVPGELRQLESSSWFEHLDEITNGVASTIVAWVGEAVADPELWAAVGNGAIAFGVAVFDGISTGIFVFILSIYFIATLDATKQAGYSLVAGSNRASVESYSERIMRSIGSYLSGMVILAFFNAVFSTVLFLVLGLPFAFLIGVMALFITLIPLIGTIITTTIMTVIALFSSPVAALVVLIAMLVYMQIEAYVLTPRVMSRAVQVPGTIVLISALAGGTLLGLLGALVAIPISAGILLIVKEVVVPRKALE